MPIVLAFVIWAGRWQRQKILLHTDNIALVSILNKKTSKSKRVMQLLRPMLLQSMLNEIQFKAVHVNGKDNIRCDALSRLQLARFHRNFPEADKNPTTIPAMFRQLLSEIELSKF